MYPSRHQHRDGVGRRGDGSGLEGRGLSAGRRWGPDADGGPTPGGAIGSIALKKDSPVAEEMTSSRDMLH
jgi:hypothetical protein